MARKSSHPRQTREDATGQQTRQLSHRLRRDIEDAAKAYIESNISDVMSVSDFINKACCEFVNKLRRSSRSKLEYLTYVPGYVRVGRPRRVVEPEQPIENDTFTDPQLVAAGEAK